MIGYGGSDIFLTKLDSTGNQQFFRIAGGSGNDYGKSVSSVIVGNNSGVYLTGTIYTDNPIYDFNGNTLSGYGDLDIFVSKFNAEYYPIGIASEGTTGTNTKTVLQGKVPLLVLNGLYPYEKYYADPTTMQLTLNPTVNFMGVTDGNGNLILK